MTCVSQTFPFCSQSNRPQKKHATNYMCIHVCKQLHISRPTLLFGAHWRCTRYPYITQQFLKHPQPIPWTYKHTLSLSRSKIPANNTSYNHSNRQRVDPRSSRKIQSLSARVPQLSVSKSCAFRALERLVIPPINPSQGIRASIIREFQRGKNNETAA